MAIAALPPTHASSFSYHGRDLAKIGATASYLELVLGSREDFCRGDGWQLCDFWDGSYRIGRFHVYVTAEHGEFQREREGGQKE